MARTYLHNNGEIEHELSGLYEAIMSKKITKTQRMMIAQILKDIATEPDVKYERTVQVGMHYCKCLKESKNKF